jgi:hypothetical protein
MVVIEYKKSDDRSAMLTNLSDLLRYLMRRMILLKNTSQVMNPMMPVKNNIRRKSLCTLIPTMCREKPIPQG